MTTMVYESYNRSTILIKPNAHSVCSSVINREVMNWKKLATTENCVPHVISLQLPNVIVCALT